MKEKPAFRTRMINLRQLRQLHQTVAPIVLLPLFVTVFTGVTYRLGKSWLGWSRDQVHWLMVIHEGEYLGQALEPIYVLFNGLGLLWMLVTGGMMVWQNLSKTWQRRSGTNTIANTTTSSSTSVSTNGSSNSVTNTSNNSNENTSANSSATTASPPEQS